MLLEFFNHDLNRLSCTEYEIRDEINHIRHVHLCKPVLGSGFPIDQGRANKQTSKRICISLIVIGSGIQLVFAPISLLDTD